MTTVASVERTDSDADLGVRSIRRVLDRERRLTEAERTAFEAFADEVRELSPTPATPATADARHRSSRLVDPDPDRAADVVRAYRATVMSVDHYADEYDETPAESLGAEFGPEVATALAQGSFTPQIKRALLDRVDAALDDRDALLDALRDETRSVEAAVDVLEPVRSELASVEPIEFREESFGALDGYRTRLAALTEKCDDGAAERQAALRRQRRRFGSPTDSPTIQSYVYRDLDVTYPVLSLFAETRTDIERVRSSVERAMAVCP